MGEGDLADALRYPARGALPAAGRWYPDYVGCTRRHASSIAIGSVKSLLQAPWVWLCS